MPASFWTNNTGQYEICPGGPAGGPACGSFPALSETTWEPNHLDTTWVTDHFEADGGSQVAIRSTGSVDLPHDVLVVTVTIEVYEY